MTGAADDELSQLRAQVDAIDAQIVELINARARVVVEIGRLKQNSNEPVYAPDREKAVLERLRQMNRGPLPDRALQAVYRELMSGSFALERPLRIGYLGPPGSFSHAATSRKFGASVEHVPLDDIASVFRELARGHVDYGLVPVENSIHGSVVETLDALIAAPSGVQVCAEVLLAVHHHLLANEPWEQVARIASKPEVFAQCRNWLTSMAAGRSLEPAPSTSRAAQRGANEPGTAAIGSALAAELYGLHPLFENIEDDPNNVTRFLVVGREPARRGGDDKTAILFRTAHTPGALAEVLDVFKSNGINLTDIEKRPSRSANWEYYFFVEAQGHLEEPAVRKAVDEAKKHCLQLVVVGSYPRATSVL